MTKTDWTESDGRRDGSRIGTDPITVNRICYPDQTSMADSTDNPPTTSVTTRCWQFGGRVQGVGFRPLVRRLAHSHGLAGWVRNGSGLVEVLAQGRPERLDAFERALLAAPPPCAPRLLTRRETLAAPLAGFRIASSLPTAVSAVAVPPDQGICADCRRDIDDPGNRRYRYPFTHCTACGPRFSAATALPFDREHTTLAGFPPCSDCQREYDDPTDRRHHAQMIACPACGPRLSFRAASGAVAEGEAALAATVAQLRSGAIVAVRGNSGYHLLTPATDEAIARLRQRKSRPDKPLALMFPYGASAPALSACVAGDGRHDAALNDPARPIVLIERRPDSPLPDSLAPDLTSVGVMLPYSPLHHLLLKDFGAPLVVTSANPPGQPVLTDAEEVEGYLAGVANAWLHHDRPIRQPAEDPVWRIIGGRPRVLRPGRGDAPIEARLPFTLREPLLAVGGQQKSTVALAFDRRVVVSPQTGRLDNPRALARFEAMIADLQALYHIDARRVACDAHPGYASHRWAHASGLAVTEVQHHAAHAAIVSADDAMCKAWLVFAWDGVGLGTDGTLWGGEALCGRAGDWRRVATFRPLRIAGGERIGRDPWRSALALCLGSDRDWPDCPGDPDLLRHAWRRGINCVTTSAVGRLFDAAAALAAGVMTTTYEGQGPMILESLAAAAGGVPGENAPTLPLTVNAAGVLESDWRPLTGLLCNTALPPAQRASLFHETLAVALRDQARALRRRHGDLRIGLSGGVFQNRLLSERVIALLAAEGFVVRLPEAMPYNDAGLSYGQIIEAAHRAGIAGD